MEAVFIEGEEVEDGDALEEVQGEDFGEEMKGLGISGLGLDEIEDQVINQGGPDLGHHGIL